MKTTKAEMDRVLKEMIAEAEWEDQVTTLRKIRAFIRFHHTDHCQACRNWKTAKK